MIRFLALGALVLALGTSELAGQEPETMKAAMFRAHGGPEVAQIEQVPIPSPAAGEVLVRVRAAGVNPADWKLLDGTFGDIGDNIPFPMGWDVSGEVAQLGADAERFEIGDEVFAYLPGNRPGSFAQYVAVPESVLALKPESLSHEQAAAVPLACLTAWQALVETAELSEGQTVLIHAGAGGVGHFAVQVAKARGARVIATASPRNHEFLRELGADEVIDYRTQNFWEIVSDVDVVLDPLKGETRERSYGVIKEGGYLISILFPPPDPEKLEAHGIRGSSLGSRGDAQQLALLASMIDEGTIMPHVSMSVGLDDVVEALEQSKSGHTRGKIVLTID